MKQLLWSTEIQRPVGGTPRSKAPSRPLMMKQEPVTESRSERGLTKIEDDFPDLSLEGFELHEHSGPCEGTEGSLITQANRLLH